MTETNLKRIPPLFKDRTGLRFGRLTVISRAGGGGPGIHAQWLCRCDCGKEKTTTTNNLTSGGTLSCGCLGKERAKTRNITHGLSRSRIYGIWVAMIKRCYKPYHQAYADYGGRGIYVCDEWRAFPRFYAWVLTLFPDGNIPKGLTLDRYPDNDGPYSPENCRWATREQQENNKRSNKLLTFHDKTQTMAQWARELNINGRTLKDRIRSGWSVEDALTIPVHLITHHKN